MAERGELTLKEVAAGLGVSTMTVLRLIGDATIGARQVCKGAPWAIPEEEKVVLRDGAILALVALGGSWCGLGSVGREALFFWAKAGRASSAYAFPCAIDAWIASDPTGRSSDHPREREASPSIESQKYGMSSTGFPAGSYWGIGVRGRSLLRLPRLKRLRTVRTLFIV